MFRKNLLALSSNCLEFHMLLKVGQEIGFILMLLKMIQVSGILVCEAGCILENLDNFVGSQG